MEDWFGGMRVSLSGLKASRLRLDAATQNLANAESSSPTDEATYRVQHVRLQENTDPEARGVRAEVVSTALPPRREFLPGHPDADADGIVRFPDVDVVEQMTQVMAARRAYELGLATFNEARHVFQKTLEIGRD